MTDIYFFCVQQLRFRTFGSNNNPIKNKNFDKIKNTFYIITLPKRPLIKNYINHIA